MTTMKLILLKLSSLTMLEELRLYHNLGTPNYFHRLFIILGQEKLPMSRSVLEKIFHNRIVDGKMIFDGCIDFALSIGALECEDYKLKLTDGIKPFIKSVTELSDKIVELFFE